MVHMFMYIFNFLIFSISAIEILGRYNVNKSIKYLRDIKVVLLYTVHVHVV